MKFWYDPEVFPEFAGWQLAATKSLNRESTLIDANKKLAYIRVNWRFRIWLCKDIRMKITIKYCGF
jgi:hypothetical protein